MYMYSAEPTRPHHGSSRSNARLNFNAWGNLKFGSIVSIWQVALLVHTPGAIDVGPGWLYGSGLKGALAGLVVEYCFAETTPLFTYGLDSHTVGGVLWNRPTPPRNCVMRSVSNV